MVPVPVFCRMALICVRTVEIFTPCSRAISAGVTPRPSAASTRVSAAVSSWLRAKHCSERSSHTLERPSSSAATPGCTGTSAAS